MNSNCTLSLWSCLCYSIIVVRILWYLHNGEGIFFPWQWALSGHPPSKTHLTSTFKKPSIVIYIGVITPSQARCCPCRHGLDIVVYICKSCYTYWSIQYLSVIKKKGFQHRINTRLRPTMGTIVNSTPVIYDISPLLLQEKCAGCHLWSRNC